MNRFAKILFWTGLCLIVASVLILFSVPTNFSRMEVRPAGETQSQIDAEFRAAMASIRREQDFFIYAAVLTGGIGVLASVTGGVSYLFSRTAEKWVSGK